VILTGVTGFEAEPLGGPRDPEDALPSPRTETPPPRGIALRIDTERHGTLRLVTAP